MSRYDIVLKGGVLVDPVNKRREKMDIGIKGGKIEAVKEYIDTSEAEDYFELDGRYVMPGIVDMHMHASKSWAESMLSRCLHRQESPQPWKWQVPWTACWNMPGITEQESRLQCWIPWTRDII